jgi:hypothetical protein
MTEKMMRKIILMRLMI